ncbi:MAG: rod shape-determining protein RodA [Microscillaceae bacterium]
MGDGLDGITLLIYLVLVAFGWMNIFAAVYDADQAWFAFSLNYTKQLLWIGTAGLIILLIIGFDYRTYETFAYLLYGAMLLLLIGVMFFGREVNGARAWIDLGPIRLQPAEFAKFITALTLARYLTQPQLRREKLGTLFTAGSIIALPALLIILQNDTGSALVFSVFALVLYREGLLPGWFLPGGLGLAALFVLGLSLTEAQLFYFLVLPILSAALLFILSLRKKKLSVISAALVVAFSLIFFVFSIKYIFENFLAPHQKERILVLLNEDIDPQGRGPRYNLFHSRVAIGSGGFWGKGFLNGTQTKLNYVPAQSTDFIFCTIGEEHGWVGSFLTIGLFTALLARLVLLAERQRDKFVRIYGYSVAGIFFFHFAINIGMTIGLFPVVGIPLPFLSYGGSSLWSFTILLFIFLKLDAHRDQQMERK